jgi:hypothetical protein
LRTMARITAFSPGQSPPPVSIATRMGVRMPDAAEPLAVSLAP